MIQYMTDALNQYTLYEYLWFFIIYAAAGWCLEVVYHVVTEGHFINRGFLNGPVCPIYGFGMVIIIICLMPLKENKPVMFFGSIVLATLLELITGFLLEKLFHQRWWDYSNEPFNFHGYICLKFSLEWGIACIVAVDIIHTFFAGIIQHFPLLPGKILLGLGLALFAADCTATVISIRGLNNRLRLMSDVGAGIRKLSDSVGESITDATLQGIEKSQQVKEQLDDTKEKLDEKSDEIKKQLAAGREKLSEKSDNLKEQLGEKRLEAMAERAERNAQREAELEALKLKLKQLREDRIRGQRRIIRAFPDMKSRKFPEELEKLKLDERSRRKKLYK